ncbi:hypothetical protein DH2020_020996 [Rehmannia glutinosa]|uniref:CCHC-type domain-containing protein n=1 Tax=Rehmannia glutinosa TaxID=99300 RepID=A0ABR0WBM4_REHGL
MDPDEVMRLVEILKRTKVEDEDRVILDGDTVKKEADRVQHCLLAKVFSNKPVNREVFKQQMPKILQTSKSVEVEVVGENLFILEFRSAIDRRRTLTEGPWNLFRNLVLFQEVQGLQNPRDIEFKHIDIWVQLHNLPLAFMNKRVIQTIGGKVGTVLEIDEGEGGNCWGKFARVRVRVEMDKPLKKCVSVQVEQEKEEIIIILVYERLPDFCFACGRIGHILKDCGDGDAKKEPPEYGAWLKAASHSGGKKSREEGKNQTRTSLSGSSNSNRAFEWNAGDKQDSQGRDPDKEITPTRLNQEFEEVLSNGGGLSRNPLAFDPPELEQKEEEVPEIEDKMDLVTYGPYRDDNMGNSMGRHIQGSQTTQPAIQFKTLIEDETSSDTIMSTGRSPKKWKKLAREKKANKGKSDDEQKFHEKKKRKITEEGYKENGQMCAVKKRHAPTDESDDPEHYATAEVAMQPRREL